MLVDRHKVSPIVLADDDVGQTDEHMRLFVNRVGDAITHRRNQEVPHIGTAYRPNANPNPSAIGQSVLLHCRRQLAFAAKEFLALAQLLVFVLAHFLPALFQHARHAVYLLGAGV